MHTSKIKLWFKAHRPKRKFDFKTMPEKHASSKHRHFHFLNHRKKDKENTAAGLALCASSSHSDDYTISHTDEFANGYAEELTSSVSDKSVSSISEDSAINEHHEIKGIVKAYHADVQSQNNDVVMINDAGCIGKGTFSSVYKGTYAGTTIAIKDVSNHPDETIYFRSQQIAVMMELNRLEAPHVIRLLAYTLTELPYYLVMPYMSEGSLESQIINTNNAPLSAAIRFNILMGVSEALAFMHKHLIIHCDVKPGNILLDDHFVPHVADFDMAFQNNTGILPAFDSVHGTLRYLAPELLRGCGPYAASTDVYAFAVTLWEVLAWQFAYQEIGSMPQIKEAVIAGKRENLPQAWKEPVHQLLTMGWYQVPCERLSMQAMHDQLEGQEQVFEAAMRM